MNARIATLAAAILTLTAALAIFSFATTPAMADGREPNSRQVGRMKAACHKIVHDRQKAAAASGMGTYNPNDVGLAHNVQGCLNNSVASWKRKNNG